MHIFIPSRGRYDVVFGQKKDMTLQYAIHSGRPVSLVVPLKEQEKYSLAAGEYPCSIMASHYNTIAETYDEIVKYCENTGIEIACIMDDDLTFAQRLDFSKPNLTRLEPAKSKPMFDKLEQFCANSTPIVGTRHRRFAQNETEPVRYNRKLIGVMCCYVPVLRHYRFAWGQNSMFDHHMVLNLLESGYKNVQLCDYTQDDALGYFAPGGCADYRTPEGHGAAARALAKRFPEAVKVRDKQINGVWTHDVTIRPDKAFNEEFFEERRG